MLLDMALASEDANALISPRVAALLGLLQANPLVLSVKKSRGGGFHLMRLLFFVWSPLFYMAGRRKF